MNTPSSENRVDELRFPPGVFSTREIQRHQATAPLRLRLVLDHDPAADTLSAIEFGRVPFGQGEGRRIKITNDFTFQIDALGGWPVGFDIQQFSGFATAHFDEPERIEFLRFDAPLLGLTNASADHVAFEASSQLAGAPTLARRLWQEIHSDGQRLFDRKSAAEIDELLLRILRAGDMTAHLGIGAQRLSAGDTQLAVEHLRTYTRLAPSSRAGLEILAVAEKRDGNSLAASDLETYACDLHYEADRTIVDSIFAGSEA